jgi:hypothetical protein
VVASIVVVWLIVGNALARVIVPLTEKLMAVGVPDESALALAIADRSEPAPLSLRFDTTNRATLTFLFSLTRHDIPTLTAPVRQIQFRPTV